MVSGDTIIAASATIMVGLIFLVSLRKALRIPVTAASLDSIAWPMAWLFLSTFCVLLGEDGAFQSLSCKLQGASSCPTPGNFLLVLFGRIFFLAGVGSLVYVLAKIQGEAKMRETLVPVIRTLNRLKSHEKEDGDRKFWDEALERVMEGAKSKYGRELVESAEEEAKERP